MDTDVSTQTFNQNGFLCINGIYNSQEIDDLIKLIQASDQSKDTFRKSKDLFAVRQFLKEVPDAAHVIFNNKLKELINNLFGDGYFVTKSIYFDKPGESNWFVAYHQDLTISVDKRVDLPGFGPWTVKQNQFAVQPPVSFLEQNLTIRIHLDDTTPDNGALKILVGSHLRGVERADQLNFASEQEVFCSVNKGGVMLMRPLLFHASDRTTNSSQRRVIHIEFGKAKLPQGLNWSEQFVFN